MIASLADARQAWAAARDQGLVARTAVIRETARAMRLAEGQQRLELRHALDGMASYGLATAEIVYRLTH